MYLSRLTLNRDAPRSALAPLLDPAGRDQAADAHHRLIWTLFADDPDRRRDFLWRADGKGRFYTFSARPPVGNDLFAPPETKPFEADLRPGDRLAFTLRANATRDRAGHKADRRVDVVMDLLKTVPKKERAGERMRLAKEAASAWMMRQGAARGFATEGVAVDGYTTLSLGRGRRAGATFGILDLTGLIRVTDARRFEAALATGFGRAKAWGCGLMLIRRA